MSTIHSIGIAVIVVIIVAYIAYTYGQANPAPASEGMSERGWGPRDINDHRRIYFHYTNWCPYCKQWRPIWEAAREACRDTGIEFIEVDEDVAKTPYVNSYPTILMLTERGERVQYTGSPDLARFRAWCVSVVTAV